MSSYFSSNFFKGNRQNLRRLVKNDKTPIVITANGLLQRGGDSTYAFSQDASFFYLTGIDEPDIVLVMDEKGNDYLIIPTRSSRREAFDGAVNARALCARSGVIEALDGVNGWKRLKESLNSRGEVATLGTPPEYVGQLGLYTNPARRRLINKLRRSSNKGLNITDISSELMNLRMIKQAPELKAIQAAIDITSETINKLNTLSKYKYEYEVEADITRGFVARGAAHAFEPIVAGGKRACTLHNVANKGELKGDELILMDIGAEVEHYAADITRVKALNGKPSPRQKLVHESVLEVQRFALNLLKPGTVLKDYEQKVEWFMGQQLIELGLIKKADYANIRKFYPHATSHFLGLNVHDTGNYNTPLKEGMVLTVEPGIYIEHESIGVRIEDDVLITEGGNKVLSDSLKRNL